MKLGLGLKQLKDRLKKLMKE